MWPYLLTIIRYSLPLEFRDNKVYYPFSEYLAQARPKVCLPCFKKIRIGRPPDWGSSSTSNSYMRKLKPNVKK
jgi:hypothetical protein